MNCQDLQRHLEAYLDGALGRAQQEELGRHLRRCARCRAEVEAIRRFEEELSVAFTDARSAGRLWERMQLDVAGPDPVADGGPESIGRETWPAPPQPRRYGFERRLAGRPAPHPSRAKRPVPPPGRRRWPLVAVAFGVLALATVALLDLRSRGGPGDAHQRLLEAPVRELHLVLDSNRPPDVAGDDPWKIQAWLAARVPFRVPEPPSWQGVALEGGRLALLLERRAAVYVYRLDGRPLALFLMPADGLDLPPAEAGSGVAIGGEGGTTHLLWEHDGLVHSLVGELPRERLLDLAPPVP